MRQWIKRHPWSARRNYAANVKRRWENRKLINDAKNKPCADCGKNYSSWVMDFDHVRGEKRFSIGPGWANSKRRILEEIEKCDVVCSNCHRERSHRRWEEKNKDSEYKCFASVDV